MRTAVRASPRRSLASFQMPGATAVAILALTVVACSVNPITAHQHKTLEDVEHHKLEINDEMAGTMTAFQAGDGDNDLPRASKPGRKMLNGLSQLFETLAGTDLDICSNYDYKRCCGGWCRGSECWAVPFFGCLACSDCGEFECCDAGPPPTRPSPSLPPAPPAPLPPNVEYAFLPYVGDRGLNNCFEDPNNYLPAEIPQSADPRAPVNFRCKEYDGTDYLVKCDGSSSPGPNGESCVKVDELSLGGYVVSGHYTHPELDFEEYTFRRLVCLKSNDNILKIYHCDI